MLWINNEFSGTLLTSLRIAQQNATQLAQLGRRQQEENASWRDSAERHQTPEEWIWAAARQPQMQFDAWDARETLDITNRRLFWRLSTILMYLHPRKMTSVRKDAVLPGSAHAAVGGM